MNKTPLSYEVITIYGSINLDISHSLYEFEPSYLDGSYSVDATNDKEDYIVNFEENPNINKKKTFLARS